MPKLGIIYWIDYRILHKGNIKLAIPHVDALPIDMIDSTNERKHHLGKRFVLILPAPLPGLSPHHRRRGGGDRFGCGGGRGVCGA
jgi:hypothetical protein